MNKVKMILTITLALAPLNSLSMIQRLSQRVPRLTRNIAAAKTTPEIASVCRRIYSNNQPQLQNKGVSERQFTTTCTNVAKELKEEQNKPGSKVKRALTIAFNLALIWAVGSYIDREHSIQSSRTEALDFLDQADKMNIALKKGMEEEGEIKTINSILEMNIDKELKAALVLGSLYRDKQKPSISELEQAEKYFSKSMVFLSDFIRRLNDQTKDIESEEEAWKIRRNSIEAKKAAMLPMMDAFLDKMEEEYY